MFNKYVFVCVRPADTPFACIGGAGLVVRERVCARSAIIIALELELASSGEIPLPTISKADKHRAIMRTANVFAVVYFT